MIGVENHLQGGGGERGAVRVGMVREGEERRWYEGGRAMGRKGGIKREEWEEEKQGKYKGSKKKEKERSGSFQIIQNIHINIHIRINKYSYHSIIFYYSHSILVS